MITKFKLFEDNVNDSEYVLYCGIDTFGNSEQKEYLGPDFDSELFEEYNTFGDTWYEYFDYSIEKLNIEWGITENKIEVSYDFNDIVDDFKFKSDYDEDDLDANYNEIKNEALNHIGFYWSIKENKEHPDYLKNKKRKDFNL